MTDEPASESRVQSLERLKAAQRGAHLFRNNSGALKNQDGEIVRYGLGNVSSKINKIMKSSDLIGVEPVIITPDMVGFVIGRILVRECKPEGWRYSGTEREVAQKRFIDLINEVGGNAAFTDGTYDYRP